VRDAKTHFHTIENRDTVGPKGKYFLRMGQGMVVPWWPFGGPMLFHLGYRRSNAPPLCFLRLLKQYVEISLKLVLSHYAMDGAHIFIISIPNHDVSSPRVSAPGPHGSICYITHSLVWKNRLLDFSGVYTLFFLACVKTEKYF